MKKENTKNVETHCNVSLRKKNSAFTLVELIIVITILAILATIGFVSYQSYTTDARDANRVTSVKEISKGLDITYTKTSAYPMPDGTVSTGAINGVVYAYDGTIGDTVSQTLRMTKATDPSSNTEYEYRINSDKTQYQIAMTLENTVANTNKITESAYAAGGAMARVMGNYKGVMKYTSGGSTYIANIPSLIWNNTGSVDLMNTTTQYVVNKKTNLPYKLNASTDLGTKSANTILQEITGTGVATLTGVNITNLTTSNFDTIFTGAILSSFNVQGASLTDITALKESVKSVVLGTSSSASSTTGVSGTCTGAIANSVYYGGVTSYSIINGITLTATGITGTPTQNTCEFTCKSGYSMNNGVCSIDLLGSRYAYNGATSKIYLYRVKNSFSLTSGMATTAVNYNREANCALYGKTVHRPSGQNSGTCTGWQPSNAPSTTKRSTYGCGQNDGTTVYSSMSWNGALNTNYKVLWNRYSNYSGWPFYAVLSDYSWNGTSTNFSGTCSGCPGARQNTTYTADTNTYIYCQDL